MILNDVNNLISEGATWDIVKSNTKGLFGGESSSILANKYARDELSKYGKDLSSKEAEELTDKRSKYGITGAALGAGIGGIGGGLTGTGVALASGGFLAPAIPGFAAAGASTGAIIGQTLGKSIAQNSFIKSKVTPNKEFKQ